MKRILFMGTCVSNAFAAAALTALQQKGIDIAGKDYKEVEALAVEYAPKEFPIYTTEDITPFDRQRFMGYMGRAKRRRW